jgi:peptide/nickel transport system permease protein
MIGHHILPDIGAPLIVLATVNLGGVILVEGPCDSPPSRARHRARPGAACLERRARSRAAGAGLAVWPGVALSLAVFGATMAGDVLRDLLDSRLRGAG